MYDRKLIYSIVGAISIGFIMVTSSSTNIGQRLANDPFLFAKRDGLYIVLSLFLAIVTLRLPINFWQRYSSIMLIISIIMLIISLMFGNVVNGASRWIKIGLIHIQPSEFTKISLFCYVAHYISNRLNKIRENTIGFLKLIVILSIISALLLAQPDLGTVVLLFSSTIAIIFIAGVKLWKVILIFVTCISVISVLIFVEPYRINRLMSFWNPWKDPFGSNYQLTQSLMALGRGGFWGQGLGNSVQKLEYLPEAHTDFILSIIGEELGYIGVVLTLLTIFSIAFRAILISREALKVNYCFSGFLSCLIGIYFSFQTLINFGVIVGMLPTKGITLPLVSYGGSSLLTMSTAAMMLVRIDHEIRLKKNQAFFLS